MAIDIVLRMLSSGTEKTKSDVKSVGAEGVKVGKEFEATGKQIDNALKPDSVNTFPGKLQQVGKEFDDVSEKAKQAGKNFEAMRNAGAGLAVVGAGAFILANNFIKVAEEGNGVEERLESILKAQQRINDLGSINDLVANVTVKAHLPDDDPVREAVVQMLSDQVATSDLPDLLQAAARNAEALKLPIDQVGTLFAKAYGEGNLTRLKRSNILFSEQEEASVKAAYGISQAAGRVAFMKVVMDSTARSTGELGSGLTSTQAAANDAARAGDDAMTTIGTGAANAKKHVDGLIGGILGIGNSVPGILEGAGYLQYFGGLALTAGGSVLGLASQVGLLAMAFPGLGVAAISAFTTMKVAALSTLPALASVASALAVPFAILAAGAAVGIAAYEALRALNIGGFGDTHKSTKEIIADTKKTLLGEPTADANKQSAVPQPAPPQVTAATPAIPQPVVPQIQQVQSAQQPVAPVAATQPVIQSATPKPLSNSAKPKAEPAFVPIAAAANVPQIQQVQSAQQDYNALQIQRDLALSSNLQRQIDAALYEGDKKRAANLQKRHDALQKEMAVLVNENKQPSNADNSRAQTNTKGVTQGAMMAKVLGMFGNNGKAYSTINTDGSVSEYAGNGQAQPQLQKITIRPKTKTTRTAQGGFAIEIVPETIYIPNDFGNAVRGL